MTVMEPLSPDPIPPSSPPDSDMDLLSQGPVPPIFSPVQDMDSELNSPTPTQKRPFDTTTTAHSRRRHADPHQKPQTSREAIIAARDLIVLASQLTQDRAEQTSTLDLLQIFREYTEKGQVRYASSIIASQVASLENISRRIDSKTKIQKPSQPAKPVTFPPLAADPATTNEGFLRPGGVP
ncbi:hypothetical protein K402DRAFT_251022 [Aulographum hederae CBS 113979]|uniref:Uncharacterized protein n=1 Tax=Aulographum hederae CBS 113979 TaxID=1176131 RepID=A0A6G1GK55_9PEZI|nr:hypothetical protein K402DRAFT_251022 [Aulographum hederae CBS 113979]